MPWKPHPRRQWPHGAPARYSSAATMPCELLQSDCEPGAVTLEHDLGRQSVPSAQLSRQTQRMLACSLMVPWIVYA